MKISELFGKTIVSTNGKRRGVILGVINERDAIGWLICCDEGEKRFFVAAENVAALSGETRFTKAAKAQKKSASLRLGKAVYTSGGKFYGYFEDCILSGMKITNAIVGGKKIPFNDLVLGDVCILKDKEAGAELAAKDMFIDAVCGADGAVVSK